ncbi:MAG: hypothetical protein CL910_13610 [Deltaproteobacteria bacterium]|jgi:uncharacterized tellurite resistance protein B-like protein|nr:hypothetical protein [Deltaproteobacteria bacterium]
MSLLRFLGLESKEERAKGETATVRAIAERLERLDDETAKFLAGFAYVLARVANADLEIAAEEADEIRRIVSELAELGSDEADLIVEIARSQARLLGGTENYVVTREFRESSTRAQRAKLLECLYAVAAADGTIAAEEAAEIMTIGEELGFTRAESNAYRSRYREQIPELRER